MNEAVDSFEAFLKLNFPKGKNFEDRTLSFLQKLDSACALGAAWASDSSWVLDIERNSRVYELFENSGLRSEIWVHGYEEYSPKHDLSELLDTNSLYSSREKCPLFTFQSDSQLMSEAEQLSQMEGYEYSTTLKALKTRRESTKNSLYTNIYGDFIYGLIKHAEDSSYTKWFALAQFDMPVSPCVLVPSLIDFNETMVDLSDTFIRRIIVVELYFPIVHQSID